MIEGLKNDLKSLIADDQLLRAFSTLEAYLDQKTSLFNSVLHLRGKFKLLETHKNKNLISLEQAGIDHSKISWALIEIVDKIREKDLLTLGLLNKDYDEDWDVLDYSVEFQESQKEFITCLEKINQIQKKFSSDLDKTKITLDNLKSQSANGNKYNNIGFRNATIDFAKYINNYIEGFSNEIEKFDILTNRTTYASFKIIEFMTEYDKKINVKQLKQLLEASKKYQKTMKSLEKSFRKSKNSYEQKFSFGKELNAARRRALAQHDMFVLKCRKSIQLLDIHHENVAILILEFQLNNSFIYKILSIIGFKRKLRIKKYNASQQVNYRDVSLF